jgi:ABC-2 type transport system ATP-binding protein
VSIVSAEHVSKWYGQVIGLNDVTLTVPPGITGLLGPNGAGKSTFMKLVTGQLKPSKGAITVFGEPIWNTPRLYFRIGFCPEQDAFYERMTGLEWVTALVRLNGLAEDEARTAARRALETVDLADAADKKIGAYSKGMRQRVKMAQALAHDPELLILDEPLSGMDPLARRKTIRLIREWGRTGRSVIVSSHILHEIEAMTSNILLINQGRIVAEGDVHQIRDLIDEHPHTVHIKAERPRALAREFLGSNDVLSLRLEETAVIVQTARPDAFYARLTELAASNDLGAIHEVTSPADNLQAVFQCLVRGWPTSRRGAPPTRRRSSASSTSRSGRCSGRGDRSSSGWSSADRWCSRWSAASCGR